MCIRDRLSPFQHKKVWKAEDGVSGKRNNLFGKNAEDLTIPLPIGTVVSTLEGKVLFEVTDTSSVSYTHLRAHETVLDLVCRLLLEKKKHIHQIILSQSH